MIFQIPFWPIDSLSLLMAIIIGSIAFLVFIYSFAHIKFKFVYYYLALSITVLALFGTVFAKDLLTFYIFLEMMSAGTYFLIIHNGVETSFRAGYKYILCMLIGGLFVLTSGLLLYNYTGTFDLSIIKQVAPTLTSQQIAIFFSLFSIGCLIKIGAVPFHIWLPDAHPAAPSPISALLSGVTIKIGAYGIIRMLFILGLLSWNLSLITVGVASMLFGVILALLQTNLKKLLAYHSISQMGYILLGIGIGSEIGLAGGLFHVLNHAVFKALLFLCIGSIIYVTQKRELHDLGGLGKVMPITFITFTVGALAIAGIPPFNGFASKAMLSASVYNNLWLKLAIIFTAAGTFASFLKIFRFAFLGELPKTLKNIKDAPIFMLFPTIVLAGACLGIGIFSAPIISTLIAPAIKHIIIFDFWNMRTLIDTLLTVFLGTSIYILGLKTGFLKTEKEKQAPSFMNYLSLDRMCVSAAQFINRSFEELNRIHTRSLNTHLLWIFLTLVVLIAGLWFAWI
ncbi:MAG: monovalent cation/H+ antiporter subunit D family protein [Candidatus Margulisbacteria bacterium]|nr:monovalent cation/H+ antiporter subunit D family protein [Candidatus Margulisiibacteriota bacterium]MBU1021847.1 monovalent cation/H+ antiporter subunit D family protein [Candidatus Margulisiibacteriota bacterium]MBU1729006.1 monovalent cation/H+ antiporter subunit D family protein [Candidatus Margulisiibacteriota bacterium]MBU1954441.1 monovalent cation/H+ antiporter subunit D family protein [Candidatus Margulisiibacteriota bacterium]